MIWERAQFDFFSITRISYRHAHTHSKTYTHMYGMERYIYTHTRTHVIFVKIYIHTYSVYKDEKKRTGVKRTHTYIFFSIFVVLCDNITYLLFGSCCIFCCL